MNKTLLLLIISTLYLFVSIACLVSIKLKNVDLDKDSLLTIVLNRLSGRDNDNEIDKLSKELETKMLLPPLTETLFYPGCDHQRSLGNSCNGTCRRTHIHRDLGTRVAQLLQPKELHFNDYYTNVLAEMRSKVKGNYDIVMLTAATPNHFQEIQSQMKSIHENVFPNIKNFTLIFYDLGLKKEQRTAMEKYCRCTVLDFPFEKVPPHVRNAQCYAFKPLIVNAHIGQGNVVAWMDASIRFPLGPESFYNWVYGARQRGMRLHLASSTDIASRTMQSTFHFFGEEACSFLKLKEIAATMIVFGKDDFVKRLIVEPWGACSLEESCICPVPYPSKNADKATKVWTEWYKGNGTMIYGLAHRFDQSALNAIIMKLYRERYTSVLDSAEKYLAVKRYADTPNYFPTS